MLEHEHLGAQSEAELQKVMEVVHKGEVVDAAEVHRTLGEIQATAAQQVTEEVRTAQQQSGSSSD